MKTCTQCKSSFEISDQDREFYQKLDLPDPSFCPACRMQNRLAFRNFFNLYHRKCDLSGKKVISMYDENFPFPVYDLSEWWSDKWDPLDYGIEVDFSKSIFDQLRQLHRAVPRMNIVNTNSENCEYSNLSFNARNTYLVFGNVDNQDCYYGHIVWHSKNCLDCLYVYRSEACYECVDCFNCYNLAFSQSCENCSNSKFLLDCTGCQDCFGCVGLKNKQYYIFNEPHTKEAYEAKMKEFDSGKRKFVEMAKKKLLELAKGHIVKNLHGLNNENSTGDYLYNCKNVLDSYDAKNCEDSRYLATVESLVNSYDCNHSPDKAEWAYQCVAVSGYNLISCHMCINGSNLAYSDNCYNSKDCFGSIGLRNKQYCIFNQQYSKEDYEILLPKIIEKMKSEGQWGQFFPIDFSPFAYNETVAQEYFPLNKEEVQAKGWRWKEMEKEPKSYKGPTLEVPDDIKDVPNDILKEIIPCEITGKFFKIIPQELQFLKDHNLPLPTRSWRQRHNDRMALRNPRKLWERECQNCSNPIETTYSPERLEKVYCDQCYLKKVY